jgi:hypothetical protein
MSCPSGAVGRWLPELIERVTTTFEICARAEIDSRNRAYSPQSDNTLLHKDTRECFSPTSGGRYNVPLELVISRRACPPPTRRPPNINFKTLRFFLPQRFLKMPSGIELTRTFVENKDWWTVSRLSGQQSLASRKTKLAFQ